MDSDSEDSIDLDQLDAQVQAVKQASPPGSPIDERVAPTHHKLNHDALQTWIYPTNLPVRDYQYNITQQALFKNVLCALPTGLGKTFIASTVMLNWYRWTIDAKIIFMAPTRPLVSQQVWACLGITGIPRSDVSVLISGGGVTPKMREQEWATKRVVFATPQTVENDIKKGVVDPRSIVCLVVDEAHRGTGKYAYNEVVDMITRVNQDVRILSLTATPGNNIEGVQQILTNMKVSKAEIRTEESIDVIPHVHKRNIDRIKTEPLEIQQQILDEYIKTIDPFAQDMMKRKVLFGETRNLSMYAVVSALQSYMSSPAGRDFRNPQCIIIRNTLKLLIRLANALTLLKIHGIRTFYDKVMAIKTGATQDANGKTKKPGKYVGQVINSEHFKQTIKLCESVLFKNGTHDLKFLGHEKLEHLVKQVDEFFAEANKPNSRAIVFVEYRESAAEVCRAMTNNCHSRVKPTLFVGQQGEAKSKSKAKKSEDDDEIMVTYDEAGETAKRGMNQKEQQRIVREFKDGGYNVLVATSIGEEGLDIGQVDMIVCYDQSKSPIRGLQRMGRTGRKRSGKVVMLLAENEGNKLDQAMNAYKHIQDQINKAARTDDSNIGFQYEPVTRILPRSVKPKVVKRMVEIPEENKEVLAGEETADNIEKLQKKTGSSSKPKPRLKNQPKLNVVKTPAPVSKKRRINMYGLSEDESEDESDDDAMSVMFQTPPASETPSTKRLKYDSPTTIVID